MNEHIYTKRERKIELIFEFLLFGIVVGVIEDLIAVVWIGNGEFSFKMFGLVLALALPFAIVGELIADKIDFIKLYKKYIRK